MSETGHESERISPTAYATGYFWYRHGMSHQALATAQGRRMHYAFRPLVLGLGLLGGISLDAMLLARHRGIDEYLDAAIAAGEVGQVIEIAAGLSPRGWRVARQYGERITYLETDLPAMAATKRGLLEGAGLLTQHHRVLELDALAEDGPQSLQAIAAQLDPGVGTAIITEGLLSYLAPAQVDRLWTNIAATLGRFPHGLYLSDLHFRSIRRSPAVKLFGRFLSRFVRGRMYIHFDDAAEAEDRMRRHGFDAVELRRAAALAANRDLADRPGAQRVRVLAARTPAAGSRAAD